MRLGRAIDRFLEQMRLERDWTARTCQSYYDCLHKLTLWLEAHGLTDPKLDDLSGRPGTDLLRRFLGDTYGRTSSTTRSTRISYLHSFFSWAEDEGFIDDDPARRIKRPPKRKPDVYRPSAGEIALLLHAALVDELPALLLMSGAGLRASELCALVWADVDLTRGRVRVKRKGGHWQYVPLDPLVADRLRAVYRQLEPDHDDHVFTAEEERWIDQERRVRTVIDPKTARAPKTLWTMVRRVSQRAGIRLLGPHALRHGFANQFLRATRERFGVPDRDTLQFLLGHARPDTTQQYVDDLDAQDAEDVLRRLRSEDVSQSEGVTGLWPDDPAKRLMEAAGIEPASAPADSSTAGGIEDEEPRPPHKRRLGRQQKGESDA